MIEQAYNLKNIVFTTGGKTVSANGAGETIAVVDAYGDPSIASDLQTFDANFGIGNDNASGQFVLTVATPQGSVRTNAGWATEQSLDVEWAHAIAPEANILLVEASSANTTALTDAVVWAESQSGVVAVSMSWGSTPEYAGEIAYDSDFTTPSGHAGVTFVASSGDNAVPNYPSTSPNVLAVGGTALNVDASGDYLSESAWSDSGGGMSPYELTNKPDVAYDADPSTGFLVYDSIPNQGISGWQVVGGTSAGSPQWAAIIALVDQGRALRSLGSLDGPTQTLPDLYNLPTSDFNPVSGGGFTGLGSPVGEKVISSLVGGGITSGGPAPAGASISGKVTVGSAGAARVTVYLDNNNDGIMDNGEPSTLTNSSGAYSFTNLPVGSYIVRQVLPTSDTQNSPGNNYGIHITLASGQSSTGDNFVDSVPATGASISGVVEVGSTGLAGVTVYLDKNNDDKLDDGEPSTVTNSSGTYRFSDLPAGTYIVRQILLAGDQQVTPTNGYGNHITLSAGQAANSVNFSDKSTAAALISGEIFNDSNGDGKLDDGETGLSDWELYIDLNNTGSFVSGEATATTNSSGDFTFGDLAAGTYIIRVMRPSGWLQTSPANNYGQHITLAAGQTIAGVLFGEKA